MSGYENKTKPTRLPVDEFIAQVSHPVRRADAEVLDELFRHVTGEVPVMWGPSMVGYGQFHYEYASGHSGDTMATGFSPRKASLSLYVLTPQPETAELLSRLGKHRTGKACLYVNTLADVDLAVLEELIRNAFRFSTEELDQSPAPTQQHFDTAAASWDQEPHKAEQARLLAQSIATELPLTGTERLLEYGAGTGLVSQALVPRVGSVTLADSSEGMRRVAREKVASGALPAETRVWDLDLESGAVPADRFDLLVASLVLHHVHDIPRVLAGFHTLLDPGGHLAIADLDAEDGTFHAHVQGFDGHSGLDRGQLIAWLGAAGFEDATVRDCFEIDKDGTPFPVFLATARRR